jgi:transcriptional regulator with XRE-family HTH domain
MERTKAASALADRVRPAPSESGYTQQSLADELGVTRAAVNEWCRGKARPRPDVMRRLEELLGITMQDWTEPESK